MSIVARFKTVRIIAWTLLKHAITRKKTLKVNEGLQKLIFIHMIIWWIS